MSFATARRDIESRMKNNWITTPVQFDNVPFNPPAGQYWVRFSIFEDDANRINIGSPGYHRVTGSIIISLFGPLNKGTNTIRDYAHTIAAIFRDAQFNGITCQEAKPTNVGELDGWYRYRVTVPFYYDGVYS